MTPADRPHDRLRRLGGPAALIEGMERHGLRDASTPGG